MTKGVKYVVAKGNQGKEIKRQIDNLTTQTLTAGEKEIYVKMFEALALQHNYSSPEEYMMLDVICMDFIRMKRLQTNLAADGEVYQYEDKFGNIVKKAHEAASLLNSVENQFRNNLKEMGLTAKEKIRKELTLDGTDFTKFLEAVPVDEVKENESLEKVYEEISKEDKIQRDSEISDGDEQTRTDENTR